MKYKIGFKYIIEETHIAEVEADTEKEAIEYFENDPFGHVFLHDSERGYEPETSEGVGIEIVSVEEE